ncbi:hypothetical protein PG996_008715 [Apiospora saccharicola]|uniref:Uncharacterized protein n=1 Tax=Apiospora saccharicola TaxID=335842 RepID=A0ABR1UYQ5_9PEZI
MAVQKRDRVARPWELLVVVVTVSLYKSDSSKVSNWVETLLEKPDVCEGKWLLPVPGAVARTVVRVVFDGPGCGGNEKRTPRRRGVAIEGDETSESSSSLEESPRSSGKWYQPFFPEESEAGFSYEVAEEVGDFEAAGFTGSAAFGWSPAIESADISVPALRSGGGVVLETISPLVLSAYGVRWHRRLKRIVACAPLLAKDVAN